MSTVEANRTKILSRLMNEGWVLDRHGSGHDLYRHPGKTAKITVPRHRTLPLGTARSIAKAAGWH